jgi:stage V sporulation protein B
VKHSFLTGAAILAFAGIICRLLGVVIRIPLANIVGNFGMGLYQMVFPLYSLLLIISSAGVPVAISKMVAKEHVAGDPVQCKRILLNSVVLLGLIGAAVSAIFMVFAYQIAGLQGNRDVGIIYIGIAPSVLLVCVIAAFRGYFQGLQNMIPTAASQILEQIVKVAAGITMAVLFIKFGVLWAVFGAILAVTVSELAALLFLIMVYVFSLRKKNQSPAPKKARKSRGGGLNIGLMWSILRQSFPVTLMASVFPLILVLDSMLIINMLTAAGTNGEESTQLFGISSGAVHTLVNLPAVLAAGIATAIVPMVSSLMRRGEIGELRDKLSLSVKITFLISIFFTAFYLAFAPKIIDLLYHGAFRDNPEHLALAGDLLKIESALIFLIGISSVFTAMLQGADRAKFPLIALLIGGAAKIGVQFSLIQGIGIYAVSLGNVVCFTIAAGLNTVFALHFIKIKKTVTRGALKMAGLGAIFGVFVVWLAHVMPGNRWWVLLAGTLSLIFYTILVAIFGYLRFNKLNVGNKNQQETKGDLKNEKSRIHRGPMHKG